MPHFVYELSAIGSVRRYVGKSQNPMYRFKGHLRQARNSNKRNIKLDWIRRYGVDSIRLTVVAGPFETKEEAFAEEVRLIAEHRAAGIPLANDPTTVGGEDPPNHSGVKRRPETVAKLRAAVKEAINRPEVKAKSIAGNLGRKKSAVNVSKMKLTLTGKKHSEQSKANMLAGQLRGRIFRQVEMQRWADDGGRS